jgi:hypothetical protein
MRPLEDELALLRKCEEIMHRHLDKIGAPTHGGIFEGDNYKLNINGRMDDYVRAHPELVKPGMEHFQP